MAILEEFLDAVVRTIRQQAAGGRTYGQLAVDLNLARSTVWHIVRGERGIGVRSLRRIMKADPPWLREVLAGAPPSFTGRNGKGSKGRPN
jgi:hypothetical protein